MAGARLTGDAGRRRSRWAAPTGVCGRSRGAARPQLLSPQSHRWLMCRSCCPPGERKWVFAVTVVVAVAAGLDVGWPAPAHWRGCRGGRPRLGQINANRCGQPGRGGETRSSGIVPTRQNGHGPARSCWRACALGGRQTKKKKRDRLSLSRRGQAACAPRTRAQQAGDVCSRAWYWAPA